MASAAIGVGVSIVNNIFSGMALRSKEATNENQVLNQVVGAFDQALQQVASAYNNGQIDQNTAESEINTLWSWMWQIQTPHVQPNRNGCSSGNDCPGTATQYAGSNGVPSGYCSGNVGASCCVICGPVRLSLENFQRVLTAGAGTVTVAKVWGDHYGLNTRESYTLTLKASPVSAPLSAANGILDQIGQVLSPLAGGPQTSITTEPGYVPPTPIGSPSLLGSSGLSTILIVVFVIIFGALFLRGRG